MRPRPGPWAGSEAGSSLRAGSAMPRSPCPRTRDGGRARSLYQIGPLSSTNNIIYKLYREIVRGRQARRHAVPFGRPAEIVDADPVELGEKGVAGGLDRRADDLVDEVRLRQGRQAVLARGGHGGPDHVARG